MVIVPKKEPKIGLHTQSRKYMTGCQIFVKGNTYFGQELKNALGLS